MRKGSAAIVPLFIAVLLLFWFIAFMGGENENLHTVNEVTNLKRTQEKLLLPAITYRYKLQQEAKANGEELTEAELDSRVNDYVNFMMAQNNIQSTPAANAGGSGTSDNANSGDAGSMGNNNNNNMGNNKGMGQ